MINLTTAQHCIRDYYSKFENAIRPQYIYVQAYKLRNEIRQSSCSIAAHTTQAYFTVVTGEPSDGNGQHAQKMCCFEICERTDIQTDTPIAILRSEVKFPKRIKIGYESVPIRLAECWFTGLAISSAKI